MKRTIHRAAHALDRQLDRRRRAPAGGRVIVSPYRGFGRLRSASGSSELPGDPAEELRGAPRRSEELPVELLVRGRVLVEKAITRSPGAEPVWRSMVNTWRRFASAEVAGAKVRGSYRDAVVETITDDEGHFQIRLEPRELASHALWHEVALELPEHGTSAVAEVMLPSELAQFGIISDIDDTVLVTNATSLLGMARSVIRNAASRLPFEGVAELYTFLHAGVNPIFYVSSSPWNLYELLHEFMDLNGIPHGPMLLQDWGIEEATFILASHETHKLAQINLILDYYPHLKFILIGDSGQHDPEIYLRVIQSHPNRVRAAFIRDVTPDLRDQGVARIIEQSNAMGVEMLYVRDSSEALTHARRMGIV